MGLSGDLRDVAAVFARGASAVTFGPDSEENRARMRLMFAEAQNRDQLKTMALVYVLDPRYSRGDIVAVLSEIEKQKGWRDA